MIPSKMHIIKASRAPSLQRIAQMGGLLVSSEMALFQMCGSAKVITVTEHIALVTYTCLLA